MTIKEFAKGYFTKTNFVDIHGRHIGYDYSYILEKIKAEFPNSKTSRDWVRKMASELNQHTKLPIRGRNNRGTAWAYAMALLLEERTIRNVQTNVKKKFPDYMPSRPLLRQMEKRLKFLNLPSRK